MKVEEKLALNKFEIDRDVHITVDESKCCKCNTAACVYACPADCYALRDQHITFSYEGCLECGSCRIVCDQGAINWVNPRGGFGISYQFG